jgi:hypothetical protein
LYYPAPSQGDGGGGPAGAARVLLERLNRLLHGSGVAMAFWHSQLIPLPLALEAPLLGSMAFLSLRWRTPCMLSVLRGGAAPVRALDAAVRGACGGACALVAAVHSGAGAHAMCELRGPHGQTQVAVALAIFLLFLLPLYLRWGAWGGAPGAGRSRAPAVHAAAVGAAAPSARLLPQLLPGPGRGPAPGRLLTEHGALLHCAHAGTQVTIAGASPSSGHT